MSCVGSVRQWLEVGNRTLFVHNFYTTPTLFFIFFLFPLLAILYMDMDGSFVFLVKCDTKCAYFTLHIMRKIYRRNCYEKRNSKEKNYEEFKSYI